MKIVLEYDEMLGQIKDDQGTVILTWPGLQGHELDESTYDIEGLIKLKNAGFTTDDIVELRRKELI